ncbi:MAG: DUF924 family protein [SAR324 cluster bacterium]|nr:DUF924 family protein [SAR324 cluster bacterium]
MRVALSVTLVHAAQHRRTIARFGRFLHRNAVPGRGCEIIPGGVRYPPHIETRI